MSSLDKYVVMSTLKNRSVSSYLKRTTVGEVACVPAPDDLATYAGTAAFPTLPADVATIATIPAFVPSHIFGCQEAGGGRILDSVSNVALVEKLLGGSTLQYGVPTTLEGGTRTAIRFADGTNQALISTDNQLMSPFGGSVGWAVVFKAPNDVTSRGLAGYGQGLTSADPETTAGIMTSTDSLGRLSAAFSDGLVGVSGSIVTGDICDDTWQIAGGFYNSVSRDCIHATSANQHTRSLSPATFIDMRQYFFVGGSRYLAQGMDVAAIYLFQGASCELAAADYITALGAIQANFLGTI